MKKIITSIVICVFGLNILGQTITSTTPGEVQLNDVLPITISTDNGNFLQASTSTFVLTDGTQTLSPVSGTLTIVNDNLLWATFDFGAGWLYEGQLLNSQVSNDVDGVMFSADAVLITGPNTTVNFAESAITVDESAGTVTATVNISDAPASATSVEVDLGEASTARIWARFSLYITNYSYFSCRFYCFANSYFLYYWMMEIDRDCSRTSLC